MLQRLSRKLNVWDLFWLCYALEVEIQQLLPPREAPYSFKDPRRKAIETMLVTWIITNIQPVSIVEDENFRRLCHWMNNKYKLPSRKSLWTKIGCMAELAKDYIQQRLDAAFRVGMTVDSWSSLGDLHANDAYVVAVPERGNGKGLEY